MVMKNGTLILLFFQLLFFYSCITRETEGIAETIIINNSGHKVYYIAYGVHASNESGNDGKVKIEIPDKEKHKETRGDMGGVDPFPFQSDSVQIKFGVKKVVTYYYELNPVNKRSPFSEQAYNIKDLGDYHYEYTYTITEEDYNNATPITE